MQLLVLAEASFHELVLYKLFDEESSRQWMHELAVIFVAYAVVTQVCCVRQFFFLLTFFIDCSLPSEKHELLSFVSNLHSSSILTDYH